MTDQASGVGSLSRWRWPMALIALALLVGAGAGMLLQVEVTDGDVGTTRACGSAFDAAADRSGWQTWWARDLDEPDEQVRDALVRTSQCPDAVNQRMIFSATMAILAVGLIVAAAVIGRSPQGADLGETSSLRAVGRATAAIGGVLTAVGLIAIVVLVADADSTLFLYTDRLVVGVAALIVLVPAIALTVGGWALLAVGRRIDGSDEDA